MSKPSVGLFFVAVIAALYSPSTGAVENTAADAVEATDYGSIKKDPQKMLALSNQEKTVYQQIDNLMTDAAEQISSEDPKTLCTLSKSNDVMNQKMVSFSMTKETEENFFDRIKKASLDISAALKTLSDIENKIDLEKIRGQVQSILGENKSIFNFFSYFESIFNKNIGKISFDAHPILFDGGSIFNANVVKLIKYVDSILQKKANVAAIIMVKAMGKQTKNIFSVEGDSHFKLVDRIVNSSEKDLIEFTNYFVKNKSQIIEDFKPKLKNFEKMISFISTVIHSLRTEADAFNKLMPTFQDFLDRIKEEGIKNAIKKDDQLLNLCHCNEQASTSARTKNSLDHSDTYRNKNNETKVHGEGSKEELKRHSYSVKTPILLPSRINDGGDLGVPISWNDFWGDLKRKRESTNAQNS